MLGTRTAGRCPGERATLCHEGRPRRTGTGPRGAARLTEPRRAVLPRNGRGALCTRPPSHAAPSHFWNSRGAFGIRLAGSAR